ncbi:hypothetical protein HDU81_003707 [Chytriomyces hyalinus]|nr:hypothetical protein HDU81_003707 [Chytriomyces hyalinus]
MYLDSCASISTLTWTTDGKGHYYPNGNTGLCLDDFNLKLNNGNTIGLWNCNTGFNQIWAIRPIGTPTRTASKATNTTSTTTSSTTTTTNGPVPTNCPIGSYAPLQVDQRRLIGAAKGNSTLPGTTIVLWEYNTLATSLFAFDCVNRLHIQADPTMCIGASSVSQGNVLLLLDCSNTNAIRWAVAGTTFAPVGKPKLVMDNFNLVTANGNPIGLWGYNGGWNQKWAEAF